MKKAFLAILVVFIFSGCATSQSAKNFQLFQKSVDEYIASVNQSDGPLDPEVFFANLAMFATKFNQTPHRQLYQMMNREASLKKQGLANRYDQLRVRFDAADIGLFQVAELYQLDISTRNQCASFGFISGSADFNKCTYDLRMQYQQLWMQQQQLLMQIARPTPIVSPKTMQTNCANIWGGGIQCRTTGY